MASEVIDMVPLKGKVITGDALYCQREYSRKVMEAEGDYLVIVKGNQPTLYEDIELAFAEPVLGEEYRFTEERGRHGDRQEVRRLWSTTALSEYLDWPGARQVCKIEREVERKGKVSHDLRYAITSLGEHVGPDRLLKHVRGHWGIENKLHYVRDVTLGEDASQVRRGSAPQVMAVFRNILLGILRLMGATNIAGTVREIGWKPGEALRILRLVPP